MKVLTPGEKIKNIREILGGIPQGQITKRYNKSQISKVETGKANITIDLAKEVVECAYEISNKKGIPINITVEELMEDFNVTVIKKLNKLLEDLKNIDDIEQFKTLLLDIEFFMEENSLEKDYERKLKIFKLAADMFFKNRKFSNCKTYILKGIDIAFILNKNDDVAELILILTRVCAFLEEFETIIIWGQYVLNSNYGTQDTIKRICFNIAKAHKSLENFNECIKMLNKLEKICYLSEYEKVHLKILLANCYRDFNLFYEAENIYKSILISNIDKFSEILIYENLSELYYLKKDFKLSLKYINFIFEYLNEEKLNDEIEHLAWHKLMLVYDKNDKNFESIKYFFRKAITAASSIEDVKSKIEIYNTYLNICIIRKQNEEILSILKEIETTKDTFNKDREILDSFIYSMNFFKNDKNNLNLILELMTKLIDFFQ